MKCTGLMFSSMGYDHVYSYETVTPSTTQNTLIALKGLLPSQCPHSTTSVLTSGAIGWCCQVLNFINWNHSPRSLSCLAAITPPMLMRLI